jgi:hypothetical protein
MVNFMLMAPTLMNDVLIVRDSCTWLAPSDENIIFCRVHSRGHQFR